MESAPEIRVATAPSNIRSNIPSNSHTNTPSNVPAAMPAEVKPSMSGVVKHPATSMGIPAKDLIKKSMPNAAPAKEEISKTVDELSRSMDDDIAMVRKVEEDFASGVEDLLEKLDLGHLKRQRKG